MKPSKAVRKRKTPVSDLTALLRPYSSGWVALSPDQRKVIASAPTVEEAHEAAAGKGCPNPVLLQVIPPDRGFTGALS